VTTVVGWPRSGTHWLKTLLGHALEEEVLQSHCLPEPGDGKFALIVRDPRDVFASHWRLYRHDNPDTDLDELQFVDYFMKGEGLAQEWGIGWVPHTRRLVELKLSTRGPLVFYEGLHTRPELTLTWLASELEAEVNMPHIMQAVHKTRGVRCDPSTLPVDVDMGEPGKWRAQIQPATVWALEEYCGELMDELGYARGRGG